MGVVVVFVVVVAVVAVVVGVRRVVVCVDDVKESGERRSDYPSAL